MLRVVKLINPETTPEDVFNNSADNVDPSQVGIINISLDIPFFSHTIQEDMMLFELVKLWNVGLACSQLQ